jgi:hypothetical protein
MATGTKRKTCTDDGEPKNHKKKPDSATEREDKFLAYMMRKLMQGDEKVSFRQCAEGMGFMERTKTQREAWKALLDKGFIEPCAAGEAVFTSDHALTKKGKDYASTPEYQEYLKEQTFESATNQEHQARLRKKFINDHGRRIFDLLLEHGSLTRQELAAIIGVNDRSHGFSYALQQLKDKKNKAHCVEDDPTATKGKLRLTDSAFLKGQRPESKSTDVEKILALISETESAKVAKPKRVKKPKDDTKTAAKTKDKKSLKREDNNDDAVEEAPSMASSDD